MEQLLDAGGPPPAALWRGGGRRDEWRPVDLRPSGVRRTTGLPRVGTGAVQRLRATARDAVARLTAPRAGRCRHGRGAGRPHPPSTRSLTVSWRRVPESVGEAAERIRTSQERVRRLMRARLRPRTARVMHTARRHMVAITTAAPDVMWGTDMTSTVTVGEGATCVFVAVDHCTTECIGLHAAKRGTRFEALEPIRQGVRERFGPISDGVARGLRLATTTARTTWLTISNRRSRSSRVPRASASARRQWGRGAFHPHVKGESLVGAELRNDRGTPPRLARVSTDVQRAVDAGEVRLSESSPSATRFRRAGRGSVDVITFKLLSKNPGALHGRLSERLSGALHHRRRTGERAARGAG